MALATTALAATGCTPAVSSPSAGPATLVVGTAVGGVPAPAAGLSPPEATSPPHDVSLDPRDGADYVLRGPVLVLPDQSTVERKVEDGQVRVVHTYANGTSYHYLKPGDAEVRDGWIFSRDTDPSGTIHARAYVPRVRGEATKPTPMAVGDKVTAGTWSVQWGAVMDGSMDHTNRRMMQLLAYDGTQMTGAWQFSPDDEPAHEFVTWDGLQALRVEVTAPKLVPDGLRSTVSLRLRVVDQAKEAKLGMELAPGVWRLPSGLRFSYKRGTSCATSATNCVCTDHHVVQTASTGPGASVAGVPEQGSVRHAGHEFRRRGAGIVVGP